MKNLLPERAKWIKIRMGLLCGIMALGLGGFVTSAYRVQVEDNAEWRTTAENQRQRRLHIEPKRGTIYDRNGTQLAVSVEVPSVSVDAVEMIRGVEKKEAQDAVLKDAAVRVAAALHLDATEVHGKLAQKRRFLWLKRRVSGDEAQAIRDLGDPKKTPVPVRGLAIEGEGKRYYPSRELAGTVLGFVAPDGFGKDGLELAMDEELRGKVEEVKGLRDRNGRLIFSEGTTDESALAGHNVHLSIDEGIQHVVERELDAAGRTYETKGASLVVMDPNTGEILAMAASPGYNPNDYGEFEADSRRDRAVTDRFEPGSVMKVFTVAAALAAGTLKPTDQIFCENGTYQLANVTIHDTHNNGWLNPTQVLAKSSNIGALKIALALGEPALYSAFRRFGFGEPTGLPLPGEAAGVLRPKGRPWFEVETANASFGQGISVTTVQLAVAMSAIANGGRLLEPVLVRKVTDARGNVVRENAPRVRREVVPAHVAKTVAEMLTAVAEDGGTGVEAALTGYRVAGKTATAQKVDGKTGKYSEDKYTASFVGFVPADRPRLVIAVVFDEPMIGRYGGDLAGPVFRRVAQSSLRYLGVMPSAQNVKLSKVKEDADAHAAGALGDAGAPVAAKPKDTLAAPPTPGPVGPPLPANVKVPELIGLPAKEAVRAVGAAGLVPEIEGTGKLVKQNPSPGSQVPKGSSIRLVFEPSS
ncbi:MAG: transpeptidase family protein [Myxococcales bacterium]|nr:transpeptidase family protein [Myxococcales bacterium]